MFGSSGVAGGRSVSRGSSADAIDAYRQSPFLCRRAALKANAYGHVDCASFLTMEMWRQHAAPVQVTDARGFAFGSSVAAGRIGEIVRTPAQRAVHLGTENQRGGADIKENHRRDDAGEAAVDQHQL